MQLPKLIRKKEGYLYLRFYLTVYVSEFAKYEFVLHFAHAMMCQCIQWLNKNIFYLL